LWLALHPCMSVRPVTRAFFRQAQHARHGPLACSSSPAFHQAGSLDTWSASPTPPLHSDTPPSLPIAITPCSIHIHLCHHPTARHHEDGDPRRGLGRLRHRRHAPHAAEEGASVRAAGKPSLRACPRGPANPRRNTPTSSSRPPRSARSTWACSPRRTWSRSSRRLTSPTAAIPCPSATS
jgi:hypothetical protein